MAMRSTVENLAFRNAVPLAAVTVAAAINGTIIDKTGYNGVTFVVDANYTGGTAATKYALTVKHGDTDDAMTVATGNDIVPGAVDASNAAPTQKIGYIGAKRYVQLVVTPNGSAATANTVGAIAVLSMPDLMPTK